MSKDVGSKVARQLAEEAKEKERKRKKFEDSEDKLQKLLSQLQNNETVVSVNPDKKTNTTAEEAMRFIEKVMRFIEKDHYAAAETLLRHIYRISPAPAARTPLATARRLCHQAVLMENKWVRRRATLMRRKVDSTTMRQEKRKYAFSKEQRQQVTDLLSTAILEITEGISKRSGHHYSKLSSMFEVILPPSAEETMTFVRAPVMFNAKSYVQERDFNALMHKTHDLDPGLKRIERGFFVARAIPLVGFKVPLKTPKQISKAEKLLDEKFDRKVNLLKVMLVHRSSKLYWYPYDFPVETEVIHFADQEVVENYGEFGQTSLLELDNGKLTRDEFVKLREDTRRRVVQLQAINLKAKRLHFEQQNQDLLKEISDLEDAAQEVSELMARKRLEFTKLTSTVLDEDGKGNGLAISQYRALHHHTRKMYKVLATRIPSERDRLREMIRNDRLQARILYYEYRDLLTRRAQFLERAQLLRAHVANVRNMTRGSGKTLQNGLEL